VSGAKQDIALRLRRRGDSRTAKLVSSCATGDCDGCGDVCPSKAGRWQCRNLPAVEELLSHRLKDVSWNVLITSERWARPPHDLRLSSICAIEKALRRSLDRLRLPSTIAVGMIDAWYGHRRWERGARILIGGPSKSEVLNVFPADVALQIDPIQDLGETAKALFAAAQRAKHLPPFDAVASEPGSRRRGEYYAWLAHCPGGSRVFRYGCDRYFNPLKKPPRQEHLEPKRGHPYPHWLVAHQFGAHGMRCTCKRCSLG
jgi:hypothetical protein